MAKRGELNANRSFKTHSYANFGSGTVLRAGGFHQKTRIWWVNDGVGRREIRSDKEIDGGLGSGALGEKMLEDLFHSDTFDIWSRNKNNHIPIVDGDRIVDRIYLYYFPAIISVKEQSVPRPKKNGIAVPYRMAKWGRLPDLYHYQVDTDVRVLSPNLVIIRVWTRGRKSYSLPSKIEIKNYYAFVKSDNKWVLHEKNKKLSDRINMCIATDVLTGATRHRKIVQIMKEHYNNAGSNFAVWVKSGNPTRIYEQKVEA